MKYTAFIIVFLMMNSAVNAQHKKFNFDQSWERVYHLELQGRPKSAAPIVDSIYTAAKKHNQPNQVIQALIYQSKFILLVEENAQRKVIENFRNEIDQSSEPFRNLLQSMLAGMYLDYYAQNQWRIRERSKTDNASGFLTWDSETFLDNIAQLYESSLEMGKSIIYTPLSNYEILLDESELGRKYRPLLFDLLANKAIDYFDAYEYRRKRSANSFNISNPRPFYDPTDFLSLTLSSSDSSSFLLKALRVYQRLIELHKTDEQPYAIVDLELKRKLLIKRSNTFPENNEFYFQSLEELKEQYANHDVSTMIDYELARFLNQEGDKYDPNILGQNQFKRAEALRICNEAVENFPNSFGAKQCKILADEIKKPSLSLRAESYILPHQATKVLLSYKNYDRLKLSTYKVNSKDSERFERLRNDSSRVALLNTLEKVEEWTVKVKNEKDYQEHSTELLFPAHDFGSYLVVVSNALKDNELLAFDMVQVTQLAIVQVENASSKTYRVIDRNNGNHVSGVSFHVYSTSNNQDTQIDKTLTTNESGEVSFSFPSNRYGSVNIELINGEDKPVFNNIYQSGYNKGYTEEEGDYEAKMFFFTDRGIYRPGQEVHFKGILIKQTANESKVVSEEKIFVTLLDPNDEPVGSHSLVTNEFGSISGSFKLPKSGLTGEYSIEVDEDMYESPFFEDSDDFDYQYATFSVEEYKRPKFEVTFTPTLDTHQINDSIFVEGNAIAFAGSNVSNAKVRYSVVRSVDFDRLNYYSPPRYPLSTEVTLVEGEMETDLEGKFIIPFKAVIDSSISKANRPVFVYRIEADVIDINGETHSAETQVKVAHHTLKVSVSVPSVVDRTSKNLGVFVNAKSLNGEPQQVLGDLKVYKLVAPEQVKRSALWDSPDYAGFTKEEHDKLFPHLPYQNESEVAEWPKGRTFFSDSIQTDSKAVDLGQTNNWPTGKYLLEFITLEPSGDEIVESTTFELTDFNSEKVSDNLLFAFNTEKESYSPGEVVKFRYGTAAKDLVATIWIKKGDEIVQKITTHLNNELKTLEIPVNESDRGGFSILYFYSAFNDFNSGSLDVEVTDDLPKLDLEVGTFRNKLEPGVNEQWSFKVLGENGKKASAELLASMYDASLDQFRTNEWSFSPFREYALYTQNSFDRENSFNLTFFRNLKYEYSPPSPSLSYDALNYFGFSFVNPSNVNQRYLNDLRWRKKPNPVLSSKKIALKNGFVAGKILDEEGSPLISVNVLVKGKNKSVSTNAEGYFELEASKGETLLVRFLGYKTYEFKVGDNNYFEISLLPDLTDLGEVIVTGYGVARNKKSLSYSIAEIPDDEEIAEEMMFEFEPNPMKLTSLAPGIRVTLRGTGSITPGKEPLYIVDGVIKPFSGLNPEDIVNMEILSGTAATSLYGAQAVNGVVLITTKRGKKEQDALLAQVKTRQNLNETAFFFPTLRTDAEGNVSFNFESPESLTQWNFQLLAHNKELASAILKRNVVTQKELMVLPNPPRFLREGDTLVFASKIASLSLDSLKGTAQLQLFDALTEQHLQTIILGVENKSFSLLPKGSTNVEWRLFIPKGISAIRYKVVATTGSFSDGEESVLPVLTNRILLQESTPLWVNAKSKNTFTLDKLKSNSSETLVNHNLTLSLTTNPIWEAIQSLPYLIEYPYECSEQTFARFYANSLGVYILEQNPTIKSTLKNWASIEEPLSPLEKNPDLKAILIEETPWLRDAKNETLQRKRLAQIFDSGMTESDIDAALQKLKDMQLSSGGFPWFTGSNRANLYITQHIITGLLKLQNLTGNYDALATINKGMSYLDSEIISNHKRALKDKVNPRERQINFLQVQYLYVHALHVREETPKTLKEAVDFYSKQAFDHWLQLDLQSQAMVAFYAYKIGNSKMANTILTSIKENSTSSEELGVYWMNNTSGWNAWQSPIETQSILIDVFSQITKDQVFIDGMKQWLLSQKRVKSWKSTKATTEAIFALLSGGQVLVPSQPVELMVGTETFNTNGNSDQPETAYFKKVWNASEVKSEMAKVTIDNPNDNIAWGGLHWQYFEDLDQVTSAVGPLSIKKQLYKVVRSASGEKLESVREGTDLALGDLIRVRLEITSDREMEYIHLKDMRASGLEPINVLSEYKWQDGLGYYESTRDAATNFFIERLPKGTLVFEYDLRVNNKGEFSNGITSIQNMYAPEFSSHSEGMRIKVGEK